MDHTAITEELLALMKQKPGLYLFGDTEMPGVTFPVVVMKPMSDMPGHIYALEPKYEVEASAEGFKPTTFLAAGPYSVQQAEADAERELETTGLQNEADFFRDIALRAEAHLRFARSMQNPKSAGFLEVSCLIERIKSYRIGQEKLAQEAIEKGPSWDGPPPLSSWEGPPPLWQSQPPQE